MNGYGDSLCRRVAKKKKRKSSAELINSLFYQQVHRTFYENSYFSRFCFIVYKNLYTQNKNT